MKCSDVQLAIGAEPQATSPDLEQHLQECAACLQYRREMQALDEQIHRALKIDLAALKSDTPARPAVRLVPSASALPAEKSRLSGLGRQWALAASVLFAVVVVLVLWGALPRHSLAADVVAHVISEPLPAVETPVPQAALAAVLQNSNLRIDPIKQPVLFAQTCFFRGRLVPHFVMRRGNAAVTVLVLPDEALKAPEHFSDNGYSGVLLPNAGHGSIAVLSRTRMDPELEAREILKALHLQPAA
jgi:Protein of unknown function (DUF3379)